ncbi:MAG: hypothetical protein WDM81_13665 [Rhizomicrobium sp.]
MNSATREVVLRRPGWVIPGASCDIHFADNRAWALGSSGLTNLLACSRASTKYAQTKSGLLAPFAANQMAITDQGCLIEQASTNLLLHSNDVGGWITANSTRAGALVLGPDNTVSAIPFQRSSTASAYSAQTVSKAASSLVYTLSVFAKANTGRYLALTISGTPSPQGRADATFDLQTGAVSLGPTVSNGFTAQSASITPAANGFFQCTLTATSDAYMTITCYYSFNSNNVRLDGVDSSAASSGWTWNLQLEQNAVDTSPIITTTAAVTRAADAITLRGAALTAALMAEAAYFETASVPAAGRLLNGGTGRLLISGLSTLAITMDGVSFPSAGFAGTVEGFVRSAFGWNGATVSVVANGGTKGSGSSPGTLSASVYVGSQGGSALSLNGYMRRLALGSIFGQFDGKTA